MVEKRRLTSRNTEIRFDSTECDINNKEVVCYAKLRDSFDISLSGFEILEEVFQNIIRGEKIKRGNIYIRIFSEPRCSLCHSRDDKCLSLDSPTSEDRIQICEKCVLLAEDICKEQRNNLIRYNELFKVLSFSEAREFHDIIEDKTLGMRNVLVIDHGSFYLELFKIEKLINSLKNPLDYEFTSKKITKDFCTVCEEKSKRFVCYHDKFYICEDCQERIGSRLKDYLCQHEDEVISLRI